MTKGRGAALEEKVHDQADGRSAYQFHNGANLATHTTKQCN
jgi:hypothetical protein